MTRPTFIFFQKRKQNCLTLPRMTSWVYFKLHWQIINTSLLALVLKAVFSQMSWELTVKSTPHPDWHHSARRPTSNVSSRACSLPVQATPACPEHHQPPQNSPQSSPAPCVTWVQPVALDSCSCSWGMCFFASWISLSRRVEEVRPYSSWRNCNTIVGLC